MIKIPVYLCSEGMTVSPLARSHVEASFTCTHSCQYSRLQATEKLQRLKNGIQLNSSKGVQSGHYTKEGVPGFACLDCRVTATPFYLKILSMYVYEYRYEFTVMYDIYEYTVISSLEFLGAIQADNR